MRNNALFPVDFKVPTHLINGFDVVRESQVTAQATST